MKEKWEYIKSKEEQFGCRIFINDAHFVNEEEFHHIALFFKNKNQYRKNHTKMCCLRKNAHFLNRTIEREREEKKDIIRIWKK
jgi:hypothetical protein